MDSERIADDPRRLDLLRTLDLVSSEPDPALDRLSRIAAAVTGCAIAMITFMAGDRQFIRSRVGTQAVEASVRESFCLCLLDAPGLVEIPDATQDARFVDSRFVLGPRAIRSYVGVPVRFEGTLIGSLCVLDPRVRRLDDDQRAILLDLAGMVEGLLQSRRKQQLLEQEHEHALALAAELRQSEAQLARAQRLADESAERDRLLWQTSTDAVFMVDEHSVIRFCNPAVLPLLGYPPDEVVGQSLEMLQPERLRGGHRQGSRATWPAASGGSTGAPSRSSRCTATAARFRWRSRSATCRSTATASSAPSCATSRSACSSSARSRAARSATAASSRRRRRASG